MRSGLFLILFVSSSFAASVNDKIQEAAYILKMAADTSRAERLLNSAFNSEKATEREKLNAGLYLARIAEAKGDSAKAFEHYKFLKNNAQSASLAYMASEKARAWGSAEEKIKIATVKQGNFTEQTAKIPNDPRFSNCVFKGELYLAQHIIYSCPDNSLRLISKKNGMETWSVSFTEAPAKVFLVFNGFFLYSENVLSFYRIGDGLDLVWRMPYHLGVQDIASKENKIFVLDINGNIKLLDKNTKQEISTAKSDGEAFFDAGIGLVGTYQKNGGISVFDSLLTHLWDYQIDGEILEKPTLKGDSVIFNLANGNTEILYTRHYQKLPHLAASKNIDSLLSLESGNAYAWYNLALKENSDSAWRKAIIYGARRQELSTAIFAKYAENIGAKWVRHLPVSSKMLYPKISSDANNLFILDTESQEILKFSMETGNTEGSISLPTGRKYSVLAEEPPWFILSSEYRLLQFSLKDQKTITIDNIPGRPHSFLRNKDSIYIGLMNGFVLKYFVPKMQLEWSRRVSSAPVLLSLGEAGAYSLSQKEISKMQSDKKINIDLGGAAHFEFKNGIFAIASTEGSVQVYSEKEGFLLLSSFSIGSQIVSFELVEHEGKIFALAGTTNQNLLFFELPSGKLVWAFDSRGSSYTQAIPNASYIWIDRDNSIVAIDISTGKLAKSYEIFGNGASIFIHGNTLYCATPQKLLYAFPID